jgi:tetratricopeptide (TPR) repeat protein
MSVVAIDPEQFIALVQPLLERQDLQGLLGLLKSRWTPPQIQQLMASSHTDARKVALLAISLVGSTCCLEELARHLKDPDPVVNEMAEHAMWSIWFRGGCPEANHQLARGAQALERRDFEHAIRHFDQALAHDAQFSEAYNQRALANYLLERFDRAVEDCQHVLERMPFHFGALAGLGHAYLNLGQIDRALDAYRRALEVNPHLHCIRQTVAELEKTRRQ